MAEEEFNLDDDLGDFGEDEAVEGGGSELPEGSVSADSASSAAAGLSRRNKIIIGAVISVVFIIGAVLFGMRFFGDDEPRSNNPNQSIHQGQTMSSNGEPAPLPKKKKKKKKIKYIQLFAKVDGDNAASILKELSFADISFKTNQNGQNFAIEVDEENIDDARNLLAIKQLPSTKARGYELLDDAQTLGVTEFDKRIRFLRALSGELEKAIVQFNLIEDATVQIVLPEQRLFAVTQPPVTSSILIRKSYGAILTDEIVFGIIQLVSNAVENLQQENVSVIDTEGNVLSEGIFERMAAKRLGIEEDEEEEDLGDPSEDAKGQPVIPNFVRIKEWFDIKWGFEKQLVERATKQLLGVLPLGSFKIAITSDIGAIENGEIAEVKRLTISIVVDNLSEEIVLDAITKRQIFSTIAGATGYVKGRDTIQLSKADFMLLTDEEKEALEDLRNGDKPSAITWVLRALGVAAVFSFGFFGFKFIQRRRKLASGEIIETDRDTDFSDIQEELEGEK
ncbi:hypothetical protein DID80_00760, partial [Candidatus Marinamargulisbacteria bacterium SCGC AAA071-K20]